MENINAPAQISTGAELGLVSNEDIRSKRLVLNEKYKDTDFNINAFRPGANQGGIVANANTLRHEEWRRVDEAIVDVTSKRLIGISDLIGAGLTEDLGDIGTMISTYEQLSDMSPANIDMGAETEGDRDRLTYTPVNIPVPITHKPFQINFRHLIASRRIGQPLDVTSVRTATRKVTEGLEGLLFNGSGSPVVGGGQIYGYTTHPSRSTGTATGSFSVVTNPYDTIAEMIGKAEVAGYYGLYGVYVSPLQYAQMRKRYTDGSNANPLSTILELLPQISFVRPGDYLANGNLVLVALEAEVVDVGIAQDFTTVQWSITGGMVEEFKVMAAIVPRVKATKEGQSGIVHYTGAE